MRFEVPQFIEIEDKIFGPLTWRQFLYLGGGVGMAVVLFFTTNFIIFIIFGLPLAALAGALAFFPVNNRPFSYFLESMFNYFFKQRTYFWRKKDNVVYRNKAETSERQPLPLSEARAKKTGGIASMARQLELEALQKNTQ